MEEPHLASLSLTHVRYNPNDPLSYASAWLALVPQGLMVTYASLIWATREVEIILMLMGQLACEAINFGLKRWIKEDRPQQMHGKGYGMPSSHAQFVAFFSVSLSLFLLLRHKPIPHPTHSPISFLERLVVSVLAFFGAAAVAYSRIYLNYHTPKQVLVGVGAGIGFGLAWFIFTSCLRRFGLVDQALEWALDTDLGRLAKVRDLVVSEDIADAGWERWKEQRKARRTNEKRKSKKDR